jgi:hypothetical protein
VRGVLWHGISVKQAITVAKISSFWARHAALPVMMADRSTIEAVKISEIEHNLGELSSANLHIAKTLFDSNGFVAWQYLWSRNKRDLERETLNVLGSLPTENNFAYVKARSLLPREIVYNKARWVLETIPLVLMADPN